MESNCKKLDTTLGELIAAASEVAFEYSKSDKQAYRLARLALIEILKKASHPIEIDMDDIDEPTPPKHLLN